MPRDFAVVLSDALGNIVEGVAAGATAGVQEAIIGATRATGSKIGADLKLFARSLDEDFHDTAAISRMHNIIAEEAQQAMVDSYKSKLGARKRPTRDPKSKYAGGVLLGALQSPRFFHADETGILFGDQTYLDQTAKQWYRMNFGSGERGRTTPRAGSHTIKLFTEAGAVLSLSRYTVSSATDLPAGFFSSPFEGYVKHDIGRVGKDVFNRYDASNQRTLADARQDPRNSGGIRMSGRRPSLGWQGYMYMEAGIRELADGFGLGWTNYIIKSFDRASKKDSGPISQYLNPQEAQAAKARLRQAAARVRGGTAELDLAIASFGRNGF